MFGMANHRSAADNIVSPVRRLGLIAEDGSLTGLGNKWRVDASYSDACQEILDAVYPAELAALTTPEGFPDRSQVLTWFQHQGYGDSNARQMCGTYLMIAEKKVPESGVAEVKKPKERSAAARKSAPKSAV
jgi:hypothetical protein